MQAAAYSCWTKNIMYAILDVTHLSLAFVYDHWTGTEV